MYTRRLLDQIKILEAEIYPEEFRMMDKFDSFLHLQQYCEHRSVKIKFWGTGYLITTPNEIIDFASLTPLSYKQLFEIYKYLKNIYKNNVFSISSREKTSYKLVKYLERKSKIIIMEDNKTYWETEIFHDLEIKFI
jgi:hypothetical protein